MKVMTDWGIMTSRRRAFVWCQKNHVIFVSIKYNIFHFGLNYFILDNQTITNIHEILQSYLLKKNLKN